MYESPGSHFSKITTGIHSVPDTFDELRFAMTFLTLMGVTEPLCGFTLVLERKTGKKIPELSRLDFLEKFLANNFALSDAEDDTSVIKYRRCSRFIFVENTISNSPKVPRAKW